MKRFLSGTNPLLDTVEGMAIKEACELTCAIENRLFIAAKSSIMEMRSYFAKILVWRLVAI